MGGVTVTGSLRSRLYGWDWFQPTSGDNSYAYSGNLLRVGFSQSREKWDWNAEFAVPFLLGLPANPTGTGPQQGALGFGSNYLTANDGNQNTAMLFPKQLYIRFVYRANRWSVEGGDIPLRLRQQGQPFILAFWHGRLLMIPMAWQRLAPMHMLISAHRDGRIIADAVTYFGVNSIAGSTRRGGTSALRVMLTT